MKLQVCAKLNLTLNVFERQGEYHPIDSVLCSVNVCDNLIVTKRDDKLLNVVCSGVRCEDNSATKAINKFMDEFGTNGADCIIEKGIAFGGGMGGSSADASAVIYAMAVLYDISDRQRLLKVCNQCGSDTAFMFDGGFARIAGRGDVVKKLPCNSVLYFVLVTTGGSNSTSQVYQAFDGLKGVTHTDNNLFEKLLAVGDVSSMQKLLNNNLLDAIKLSDEQQRFVSFCQVNNLPFNMTGSGSSFYLLCSSQSQANEYCSLLKQNNFDAEVCHSQNYGMEVLDY